MIRSPHTLVDLDAKANIFFNDIKKELQLHRKLHAHPNDYLKPTMRYLELNLETIITGRPDILENEAAKNIQPLVEQAVIDFLLSNPSLKDKKGKDITDTKKREAYARNIIKSEITKIFNYDLDDDSFRDKDHGAVAYRHAKRLNTNTCPYCNGNFTFTIRNKRMKCRPQFDHFLNKDRYPYFALSFYNLIPSCALCNSGALKGRKLFSITTHLHPFIDDIEGLYEFRTSINAVDFLVNNEDFTLQLKPCQNVSKKERKKAMANIEVFGLQDRYGFHKDIAGDVLKKSYVYNKTAIENLFTSFKIGNHLIFKSESEVKELIMGNYLHPNNFHKRILSKLTKDIAEEFGLTI
ncbi:hypothetical protein KK083_03465 [Fulvivirgaceae bacterium PWU4]|uniref:HNH endonuclease n=1 Tax=Chryseosolibacter histidini TaxID=2782349 RepID=A0AAP2GMN4_9BACT|nr:hypothetical protein [Chryseosolibacter histidini]MBT1695920.1 hypothetical protein [Chryseosolibacter histidini]